MSDLAIDPDRPISDRSIRALVEDNPDQCTVDEYRRIRDTILERAPCRLLVFGVGRDTGMWLDANRGGRTVFLESKQEWIEHTRRHDPGAEVVRVRYGTFRFMWRWLLHRPERLMMDLPAEIRDTDWDVILVDAPKGKRWRSTGRMKSIYTASALASEGTATDVLVHDCHRRVERTYCDTHLDDPDLVETVHHLRHYRVP